MEVAPTQNDPKWLIPIAVTATVIALSICVSIPYWMAPGESQNFAEARQKVGGDPEKGIELMKRYGCAACHTIPGLTGSHGAVGPNLRGFATRPTIGQHVANTPDNLIKWIIRPVHVDPKATMPSVGATEKDARDIATYLYALK